MTGGTRGAAVSEALVKDWVRAPLLHRSPSQQEPCRSMFVQGLVVPLMVQEGRWQVRTYTGAEKLPGRGVMRRGQDRGRQPHLKLHFRGQGHDWVLGLPSSPFLILGPCLLPQTRAMPPPSDQGHASSFRSGHASSLRPGHASSLRLGPCLFPQTRACLFPQTRAMPPPSDQGMPPPSDQGHASSLRPGHATSLRSGPCLSQSCPASTPLAQAVPAPHQRSFVHCPGSRRSGPGDTGPAGTSPGCSPLGGSPRRRSIRCR